VLFRSGTAGPVTTDLLDYQRTDEPVITTARTDIISLPTGFASAGVSNSPFEMNMPSSSSVLQPSPPGPASNQSLLAKPMLPGSPKPPQSTPTSINERLGAQLYLIRGRIVSNPPQTFRGTFSPDGTAEVILAGNRRVFGNFESFAASESISAKYKPVLLTNPDSLKISPGVNVKGFAALSDGVGTDLECAYALNSATKRGEGTCADNQRNTYRIVFD